MALLPSMSSIIYAQNLLASVLCVYLQSSICARITADKTTLLTRRLCTKIAPRSKFRQHLQCCTSPFLGTMRRFWLKPQSQAITRRARLSGLSAGENHSAIVCHRMPSCSASLHRICTSQCANLRNLPDQLPQRLGLIWCAARMNYGVRPQRIPRRHQRRFNRAQSPHQFVVL